MKIIERDKKNDYIELFILKGIVFYDCEKKI